jgi:Cu/Ag efflux protein CusF
LINTTGKETPLDLHQDGKCQLTDPALSDPWTRSTTSNAPAASRYRLRGTVMHIYPEDSTVVLAHDAVPGLMGAMRAPSSMEFLVRDSASLNGLNAGDAVSA